MATAARGVLGYEYHYGFSIDDEIASLCKHTPQAGKTTFLFEIRTDFIIKTKTDGGDDDQIIIDSERFSTDLPEKDGGSDPIYSALLFNIYLSSRLEEYWMTRDEIKKFDREALAFVQNYLSENQIPLRHRHVIPVAVDFKVITVQQEEEQFAAAMERAVRAEKLIPLTVCPWGLASVEREAFDPEFLIFLLDLTRTRVEDAEEKMTVMPLCEICMRAPVVGDQISKLYYCDHVFHSHCLVRWLLEKNECPICCAQAYDPMLGPPESAYY